MKENIKILSLTIILVSLISAFFWFDNFKTESVDAWYTTGGTWTHRRVIDINYQRVASTTGLTNFPMLFSVVDPNLKFTGSGGNVASSTGADILFTASDRVTKLSHEIETYASTTGQLVAWIKIPFLSSTTTTRIYIYYGNSTVSTNQQDATNVWYDYFAVYHMKENPGTTCSSTKEVCDSSWNAYHGDAIGSMNSADQVSSKIGYGLDFDGSDDQIQFTDNNALDGISKLYISAWVKQNGQGTNDLIVSKFLGGSSIGWSLQTGTASAGDADDILFTQDTSSQGHTSGNFLTNAVFNKVDMVFDGTLTGSANRLKIYHNGTNPQLTFPAAIGTTVNGGSNAMFISGSSDNIFKWPGIIDEVRISTSTRTSEWILTEYYNQNDPSSFYGYGNQEIPNKTGASEKIRSGGTTNLTRPSVKARGGVKFR